MILQSYSQHTHCSAHETCPATIPLLVGIVPPRTTDPDPDFIPGVAAAALGALLDARGIPYAIAGGIACALYGSSRYTYDLDVVVGVPSTDVRALKASLGAESDQFRSVGNALYFDSPSESDTDPLPIELLPSDTFTWPHPLSSGSQRTATVHGEVCVLLPAAIVVSKAGRAASGIGATRPRTVEKFRSDLGDSEYLLPLIGEGEFGRVFGLYAEEKRGRIAANLRKIGEVSSTVGRWVEELQERGELERSEQ